jgi:hypothetical protein
MCNDRKESKKQTEVHKRKGSMEKLAILVKETFKSDQVHIR